MSKLVQNVLPDYWRRSPVDQAVACTLKPKELLPRMVLTESPGCWIPAGTELGPKDHTIGGGEGVREEVLLAENWSYPLQDTLADCAVQT